MIERIDLISNIRYRTFQSTLTFKNNFESIKLPNLHIFNAIKLAIKH